MTKLLLPFLICFAILSCKKNEDPKPITNQPLQPTACFTSSKTTADAEETINFTNCSTNGSTYEWNFGDSTKSTLQSPDHKFMKAGTYTVKLTAYNSDKSKNAEKTAQITVKGGKDFLLAGTTSKSWQISKIMVNGMDYTSLLESCDLDDLWIFWSDNKFATDEGPTKCDETEPQTDEGSWSMNSDKTKLNIVLDGENMPFNLDEVTATTLRISSTDGSNAEFTFKAK